MSIPKNKDELLSAIHDNYAKLIADLSTIPENLAAVKELEGHAKGTVMSVNDLVAYLVGWGQLVLKWNRKRSKGLEVDFPETGFRWSELGQLAQKFYRDYEEDGFKTLLHKLDQTTKQNVALVESKTNDELYGVDWYERWTLGRMIQLNTASPFKNARIRIRKWKKIKAIP